MDRALLKERAKEIMRKNHWLCVGVAFLGTLTLGGSNYSNLNIDIPDIHNINDLKDFLQETTGLFFTPTFLTGLLMVCIVPVIVSVLLKVFVTNQFFVGSCRFFLKFRQNNPTSVSEIFQSYKDKTFLNVAKVTFLRDLYLVLWSLLFVIPGIVKSFEYFAVDYILAVRPDADSNEVFDLSKRLMKGNKFALFELNLSFIGWMFVSMFACGLPIPLYVTPYMRITQALFFGEIRKDAIRQGIITESDIPDYAYVSDDQPFLQGFYQQDQANYQQYYPTNTQKSRPAPPPFHSGYTPVNTQPPVQPAAEEKASAEEDKTADNKGDEIE